MSRMNDTAIWMCHSGTVVDSESIMAVVAGMDTTGPKFEKNFCLQSLKRRCSTGRRTRSLAIMRMQSGYALVYSL